jgi:hypothetical protein
MGGLLESPFIIALIVFVIGILVSLYIVYFFDRIFIKKRISKIDAILLFFLFVLSFYGSLNANLNYDQSLIDGVISSWVKQVSVLFVMIYQFLLRSKNVKMDNIMKFAILFAFIDVCSKIFMAFTLNPALYVDTDLVGYNPAKGGYVFRFDATSAQIAIVFFFTSFVVTKKMLYLIGSAAFLSYLLFIDKGRIDIVSVFCVMGFIMVRNLSPLNFVKTASILLFLAGSALLVAYQFFPDAILVLRNMLYNFALTVIGIDTGEGSASARFIEFGIVFDHFSKFPGQMIFGVGVLGREETFYEFGHLYVKDIGIVGIFFTYGIVGTLVLYSLFLYALYLVWKIKYYKRDLNYKVTEAILVMIFITSFFNGSFVWVPGNFLTFLMFLHYFTILEMRRDIAIEESLNSAPA